MNHLTMIVHINGEKVNYILIEALMIDGLLFNDIYDEDK